MVETMYSTLMFGFGLLLCLYGVRGQQLRLAANITLPEGLTLYKLVEYRHIYMPATPPPTSQFVRGGRVMEGAHRTISDPNVVPVGGKIYTREEVYYMLDQLKGYCGRQKHYITVEACSNDCNPPCAEDSLQCPWHFCVDNEDSNVCMYRCETNKLLRGLVTGITVVLVAIAVICFCRAWGNFKNRYNAIVTDVDD